MPKQNKNKSQEIRHTAPTCRRSQVAESHVREEKQKLLQAIRKNPPPAPGFAVSSLAYRRTFDRIKKEVEDVVETREAAARR